MFDFPPSRAAARHRLESFLPDAGAPYAARRNFDEADGVSGLSPYLRHRALTEPEVLRAVVTRHGQDRAEKFIAEVFWRTYWKGWLENRPAVWTAYRADWDRAWNDVQTQGGLRRGWEDACAGRTGIDAFDHWARQLVDTGYLHNHARMWFASIWIFTLRLPWALGADFFLRHLLDGDPASNTLSWRWVAGVQTVGKTYLARPENIATYTRGRFRPDGLATEAPPLSGPPHPALGPLPVSDALPTGGRPGLLVTEEDLTPDWIGLMPVATARVQVTQARSPLSVAPRVVDFVGALMSEAPGEAVAPEALAAWVRDHGLTHVVTPHIPTGPTRDALLPVLQALPVPVLQPIRPFDQAAWPHATKGFFAFRKAIPGLLEGL